MAFVSRHRLTHPSERHLPTKYQSAFHGPFPVSRVEPPNIWVALSAPFQQREFKLNMEDAFRFMPATPSAADPGPVSPIPDEAPVDPDEGRVEVREGDELYSIRGITRHRTRYGNVWYEVDWIGYEPTWEPEEAISSDSLTRYWNGWLQRKRLRGRHFEVPAAAWRWATIENQAVATNLPPTRM